MTHPERRKRASNHYYPKSTWLDAQWWLVEHSDWTWAKATNLDWTLVPDPLEENERSSSRRWITWTYGLLDLVDGHVTIISNRTIRTRPDPYTHRLLGRWFLLSERSVWFGISDHFNLFSFNIQIENLSFFKLTVTPYFFTFITWTDKNFHEMGQLLNDQITDFQNGVSKW